MVMRNVMIIFLFSSSLVLSKDVSLLISKRTHSIGDSCRDFEQANPEVVWKRPPLIDGSCGDFDLLSTTEMRFCYISFVRCNKSGTVFLVKQKRLPRKILFCVFDALTASIAEGLDLAHKVDIIPAGQVFPGKVYTEWPATIHTVAPGKMIKELKHIFEKFDIKQGEIGFRHDMLRWMIKYPALILIVALDTFLCNQDRHRGNLFYNPKTGLFCAIDMDSSFKYNLCALSLANVRAMLNDKKLALNNKEINALIGYKETLQFLIATHKPNDTLAALDTFLAQAGFVQDSSFYTKQVDRDLTAKQEMIKQSYIDAKALVIVLDKLIKKFSI